MIKEEILDDTISEYYDKEMSKSEAVNFEARLIKSDGIKQYANHKCCKYYEISKSIYKVKNRVNNKLKDTLFINIDAVRFESFYKHLRNSILHILRHNSQ